MRLSRTDLERGLELRQASICINRVEHSSKLRSIELVDFMSNCLALLMADSHKPPKCGVYGGMQDHSISLRERKFCTSSCRQLHELSQMTRSAFKIGFIIRDDFARTRPSSNETA
ncbi:hypothetical protein TNCV_2144751 [Trichonephila clavipes]|nr:hypothetical protein TNCV_2144751 [Trichonephila clavipes]